ncbi:MAG TPA: hypothetical protein VF142_06255 [Longimicrobium sp.]
MRWLPWLVGALVALSTLAWFVSDLVPFVLYPLFVAAVLLVGWRIARRARRPGP